MAVEVEPGDGSSGGLKITISLTSEEAGVIENDARVMSEILDSCFWAIGMLRAGVNSRDADNPSPVIGDWYAALRDINRLTSRVEGTREAAIRAFLVSGGNVHRLSRVLDITLEEAQEVSDKILLEQPSEWGARMSQHTE